jgi:hypothetical protein
MGLITRSILTFALILGIAGPLFAQEETTTTGTAATSTATTTAASEIPVELRNSSHEIRSDFGSILRQRPPEVATILSLDPTLLSDEAFLESIRDSRLRRESSWVRHNRVLPGGVRVGECTGQRAP